LGVDVGGTFAAPPTNHPMGPTDNEISIEGVWSMRVVRLAGLVLVAVVAVGLVAVSVASAEAEFTPVGSTVTGASSEAWVLTATGETLTCAKNVQSGGVVTSSTLVGGIVLHFLECTNKSSTGGTCPVMSTGAPLENLILTHTLHGVLGLILPKPGSGSSVALLLLPVSGSQFYTILGSCIPTTIMTGSIAGVVNPVASGKTTKGTLTLAIAGGKQGITEVDLSTGGLVKPKLASFGGEATVEAADTITFGTATEVT
jgi:hypothetical protein